MKTRKLKKDPYGSGQPVWVVVARVEREEQAQVVESEDIHVLLRRDKASAVKAAKREFARLYKSLARESFSRYPYRNDVYRELADALSEGRSFLLDAADGDNVVVFIRKLEVKE